MSGYCLAQKKVNGRTVRRLAACLRRHKKRTEEEAAAEQQQRTPIQSSTF